MRELRPREKGSNGRITAVRRGGRHGVREIRSR